MSHKSNGSMAIPEVSPNLRGNLQSSDLQGMDGLRKTVKTRFWAKIFPLKTCMKMEKL